MALDPDELFEKLVIKLIFIWGPFYAIFYLTRMLWREFFRREDEQ
jgi:hypothetical protein